MMSSRWNLIGPNARFCLVLFAVSLSQVAYAQSEDTGVEAVGALSGSSDSTVSLQSEAPTAQEPAQAETKLPPPAPAKPDVPAAQPPAAASSAVPISVEILPPSGYPEPRVRGIVGGSLWLTMHGQQFPYMPANPGQDSSLRIAISGSLWDDISYARIISGLPDTAPNMKRWRNQGRGVLRATPSYSTNGGWFGQGQVELVGNVEQIVDSGSAIGTVDDAFVRGGKWGLFDLTVGRFQGWEVFHYGMGLDLNTIERRGAEVPGLTGGKPPTTYGVDYYWDRENESTGHYAGHVYFTDYLRLEVMGITGTKSGMNTQGFRPVGILDLGYVKVKAGYEFGEDSAQKDSEKTRTKRNGFGGTVQFVWNPYLEGGLNGAVGFVDSWNNLGLPDLTQSTTTYSYGGFLNGRVYGPLILGVGTNMTHVDYLERNGNTASSNLGKSNYDNHLQTFGAIQYSFWDRLYAKFVFSYAEYHHEDKLQDPPHPYTHGVYTGRLRLMYLF
jgi:hypothetical protein